jgi:hypothetical protein
VGFQPRRHTAVRLRPARAPTSNHAERDLRPAKTQQKISGRLTSEPVARARYRIRGYLSTAAKHGLDQLTILRDAILGDPWTLWVPRTWVRALGCAFAG